MHSLKLIFVFVLFAASANTFGAQKLDYPSIKFGGTYVTIDNICVNTDGNLQAMLSTCLARSPRGWCSKWGSKTLTTSRQYNVCVLFSRGHCQQWTVEEYPLEYTWYDQSSKSYQNITILPCQ